MRRRPLKLPLFLVASALLIGIVVVVSGMFTSWTFERHVLAQEESVTAAFVQSQATQHLTVDDFAGRPGAGESFQQFLGGLPGVFRVKVFEPGGRIIWSNEQRLIGQTFPDNPSLARALAGRRVVTTLVAPKQREHIYERTKTIIAEAYVPLFDSRGQIMAVAETYKDMTPLLAEVAGARRRVWAVTGALGMLLWMALALVVRRASRNERRAMERLTEQNRTVTGLQRFTRSLLQPLDVTAVARGMTAAAAAELQALRAALYRRSGGGAALVAAWPEDAGTPALPVTDPGTAGGYVVRGATIAATISPAHGGDYVFVVELRRGPGEAETPLLGTLEIMLNEASVALANAALYTEVREAHERLAAILAGVTDRMVIIDRDMRVVWTNGGDDGAIGSDAIGRRCFEVFDASPESCSGCPAERTFHSGHVERGVRTQRTPGGAPRHLDLICAPLRDATGRVDRVLEVARDITELVEMEERLKVSAERLEESHAEIMAKAEALEQSNRALQAAQAQLVQQERLAAAGEVVVGLHHTILNPLTGILGACQIIKQDLALSAVTRQALDAAMDEVRRIEAVVRQLPLLHRVAGTAYVAGTRMLDLERSCEEDPPRS
ncbi:MAG: PAS domain-containing protein [Candidatus Rokubacteria bacterium]|nr:PAS domain-containing protein [Candidatus Rokubacteria bacterium]